MNTLKWILVALMVLFASAAQAQSTLITFDDLDCDSSFQIPDGYKGFDWDNFYCLPAAEVHPVSGYMNGTVSAPHVAYNGWADPASFLISSQTPGQQFSLQSAYLTSAWEAENNVRVEGFLFGQPVYDEVFPIIYDAPTLVEFNPAAVDMVRFSSTNEHFAMDDLTVTAVEPVPVPTLGFWGLLALILASGAMAWRRLRTHA